MRLARANADKRRERHASMQTLFAFLKVAVQCHTGALHCHCPFCSFAMELIALPSFASSNAEWFFPPVEIPHSQLLLFLLFTFSAQPKPAGRALVSLNSSSLYCSSRPSTILKLLFRRLPPLLPPLLLSESANPFFCSILLTTTSRDPHPFRSVLRFDPSRQHGRLLHS